MRGGNAARNFWVSQLNLTFNHSHTYLLETPSPTDLPLQYRGFLPWTGAYQSTSEREFEPQNLRVDPRNCRRIGEWCKGSTSGFGPEDSRFESWLPSFGVVSQDSKGAEPSVNQESRWNCRLTIVDFRLNGRFPIENPYRGDIYKGTNGEEHGENEHNHTPSNYLSGG